MERPSLDGDRISVRTSAPWIRSSRSSPGASYATSSKEVKVIAWRETVCCEKGKEKSVCCRGGQQIENFFANYLCLIVAPRCIGAAFAWTMEEIGTQRSRFSCRRPGSGG